MKIISLLLFCTAMLSTALAQASASSAPASAQASSAEADFAAFQALSQEKPPGSPKEMGAENYLNWFDANRQAMTKAALAFYTAHPADPRRWELVSASVKAPPFFIKGFGPEVETKGMGAIVADADAVAAWKQQAAELTAAMQAATDLPPSLREEADWEKFAREFRMASVAKSQGQPYDYSGFPARFDAHVAKYADLDVVATRAVDYLGALERNQPGASLTVWQHLLDAPNAALRDKAAERIKFLELISKPLALAFTAVDGRAVDFKSLRGKVVLIDFWATWCGPCVAELPNVIATYKKYHDQGFEVVGITLENANLMPKDTPAQREAKLAKAKKILTDFTAGHDMAWPQYFDGKFWKNDFVAQFAVSGIPAMFLLDQEGKVISTNARGPKLEQEVKRLLKL